MLAVFGIDNAGLSLVVNLLILFLVVVWLALIYWTYADARRRMTDPMLIGCAAAASFFPFVGTLVYVIVRPPEYLDDIRERELEMQAAEARLHAAGFQLCPYCDAEIERDFLRCPAACASSRTPARTALARSTPSGGSARTARPRSARRPKSRAAEGAARRPRPNPLDRTRERTPWTGPSSWSSPTRSRAA